MTTWKALGGSLLCPDGNPHEDRNGPDVLALTGRHQPGDECIRCGARLVRVPEIEDDEKGGPR